MRVSTFFRITAIAGLVVAGTVTQPKPSRKASS
jgi:hypothetical protein